MSVDLWILISFLIFIAVSLLTSIRKKIVNIIDNKIKHINHNISESEKIRRESADNLKEALQEQEEFIKRKEEIIHATQKRIKKMQDVAEERELIIAKNRERLLDLSLQHHRDQERLRLKKAILSTAINEAKNFIIANPSVIDNKQLYHHQDELMIQLKNHV